MKNDKVDEALTTFLERVRETLQEIGKEETKEIDIYDLMNEVVDEVITGLDRQECLAVIDDTGNEEDVDKGILDYSDIDRLLATMAYGCMEQELYNNDTVQELQNRLNNEVIDYDDAQDILSMMPSNEELKTVP